VRTSIRILLIERMHDTAWAQNIGRKKKCASQNALRHGLAVPVNLDSVFEKG
jgi:hypothetical protein